ncbi:MAG: FtsX-like permease family protein [Vicinamibacteraceae bacterium]
MRWRLFHQFIIRRLFAERVRTATTVVGIALGIAVVIAIQLTNASSIRGFETALDTIAGRTSIEIVGNGGIDESRLRELSWLRQFGTVSPVVQGEMAIVSGSPEASRAGTTGSQEGAVGRMRRTRSEAVRVLGVDILRDQSIREYHLLRIEGGAAKDRAITTQKFLEILTNERAVVIPEKLARRKGLALGGEIRLLTGDRAQPFVIRGLLRDEGPARVTDGSFVLMDIAAAQLAFNRLGRIDRIDVLVPDGTDIDTTLAAVSQRLPAGLRAQRPARRGQQVEQMLAAFHLNLTALSWVALIVGLFLVYNTVTISVIARREEIGLLRALGVTRGGVTALFLGEAAALGLAGTVLGLGLGRLLADAAVGLTSTTVSTLYIAAAAAPPMMSAAQVLLAFAIGLPLSLLAAALPAREASRVPPTAAMRGSDTIDSRVRVPASASVLAGLTLLAAVVLALLPAVDGRPLFAYASSFAIIVGASLLVPAIIYGLARVARSPLRRWLGVEGLLAHANLASAIPRLAVSIAALAVSLSMMVAIAVMVGSFRDTVTYWIGQTLQADLFVGPGLQPTVGSEQTLSPAVIAAVSAHPQVAAVDAFRNLDLTYQGHLVVLGAGTFEIVATRGSLLFKSPADGRQRLRGAIGRDAVIVSEAFANKYGVTDGDQITLDTPRGPRPFEVVAVYYDYSVDRGVIIMDRGTLRTYWGDLPPTGLAAFLRDGSDAERVRQEILDSLDEGHQAFIYTNRALRQEVLRIFDSTFAITYSLEVIAIVVAMLGVAATLLTLVIERRRELTTLRLVGAARRQVRRMVVIEAALIGAASQAIGLTVGLALSLVLIYVINVQSFGWTIQFRLPVTFLLQASVAVVIATALAGIYPAHRAAELVVEQAE